MCGCCLICAKVEGEYCGGVWRRLGTCDKGLKCIKKRPSVFFGKCGKLHYIQRNTQDPVKHLRWSFLRK